MAKIEKKEEVNPAAASTTENKTKPAKKSSYVSLVCLIILLCSAGVVAYNIELTKTLNEDLAAQLAADYNTKINNLKVQIEQQKSIIADLRQNQPLNSVSQPTSTDLSEEQLQQLASKILPLLPQPEVSNNQTKPISIEPAPKNVTAPEVLLAAGALTVRGLAEDGLPFDYETEVLQILAAGNETALNYISSIKKYAVSGIKGRAMLINEFNKVYADLSRPQINKSIEPEIQETWDEALLRRIKELVVFKKRENKPVVVFPKTPDEIHQLVNDGNFAEALNKLKTDRKYSDVNSAELNSWILQTQDYLEFEQAINGLLMNSLANLHLKEMERTK